MDKQQLVDFIENQIAAGTLTREDLFVLAGQMDGSAVVPAERSAPVVVDHSKNITSLLYGIGALIAIAGICVLIGQNWEEIGFFGRLLVTLGVSFITYSFGLTTGVGQHRALSQILFFISALLTPIGIYVLLDQAGIEITFMVQSVAALMSAVVFSAALYITKRTILVLISLGYATWWYYAFIANAISASDYVAVDIFQWATMFLGLSYLLVAYGCRSWLLVREVADETEHARAQDLIYGAGSAAILGAGISFGGVWDVLLIIPIFAAFYGSTYVRSRSMLAVAALFLIAHIINLTSKYFIDTIGWPVALIAVGFMVIGIGYMAFKLSKQMSLK